MVQGYDYMPNVPKKEGDTWNELLYRLSQLFSLHGQNKDALAKTKLGAWEYDIIGPWYKCNMTDIMAALGLVQGNGGTGTVPVVPGSSLLELCSLARQERGWEEGYEKGYEHKGLV